MKSNKIAPLSLSLLLGASAAFAAGNIYTAPSFFDENGAYFGPDNEQTNYNGAFYTGDYTSPFKTYLGKTDEEIQKKIDDLWNHYFKGGENDKLFYDSGNEAHIRDINSGDVRSEGMSYGMMISVQTNHKEEFDKLWNWAKNHMWHKNGDWDGYFAWKRDFDGTGGDDNCAPDGEMYFMMSLLFAANRWGGTYMDDAQYIMDKMWNNYSHHLFNQSNYIIVFQPLNDGNNFSDPSYDLPAYLELFSRWAKKDQDKWKKAVSAARDHLYKSSHQTSGLFTDYSNFDGTPHTGYDSNNPSDTYLYDAMRSAMNFGMDYYLFGVDSTRQIEMANRIINHFEKDGYQHARFNWDGSVLGSKSGDGYTQGEAGANAVAAMCLKGDASNETKIKTNLQKAWDTEPMSGQYRYYDGLVHYLAMLHLSGNFKIWKPKPAAAPEAKTVEGEYNGVKFDKDTTFQAFEDGKLYDVTVKAATAAATDTTVQDTTVKDTTAQDTTIAIHAVKALSLARVYSTNSSIFIENVPAGTKFTVTDMNGRVVMNSKVNSASHEVRMSNRGAFLVIVGNKAYKVMK